MEVEIAFLKSLNDVGDLREEIEGSIHTEQEPEVWNSSVLVYYYGTSTATNFFFEEMKCTYPERESHDRLSHASKQTRKFSLSREIVPTQRKGFM